MSYRLRIATLADEARLIETDKRSESEARAEGFVAFELMATLPGIRLYEKFGYKAGEAVNHPLPGPGGIAIRFVPMTKKEVDSNG